MSGKAMGLQEGSRVIGRTRLKEGPRKSLKNTDPGSFQKSRQDTGEQDWWKMSQTV